MELYDMIDLARRARECSERARREAAFWQRMIDERIRAESGEGEYENVSEFG